MNDQITLMQTSIVKCKQKIALLGHNKIVLESRIIQLQHVVKTTKLEYVEVYNYS